MSRATKWIALAIVAATIAVYAPALSAPFQFDDDYITDSPSIRQLVPLSIPLRPPEQTPLAGRPVVNYTLALNYALNRRLGVDQGPTGASRTIGYHAVNLLLHLLCGALLFGVLRRTFRRQRFDDGFAEHADATSLMIVGIWLLHPLQSEAILYVVQRTELLVSACYVGTLYAALRAWDAAGRQRRLMWYAVAVAVCLLGMGSKEVMISAPLMVVLYDRVFRWTSWRDVVDGGRRWLYLALFATTALLIALMFGGPRNGSVGFGLGITWYSYLYSQAWAIAHYLRLFVWPSGLTLDYGMIPVTGPRGIPGLILLTAAGVATLLAWRRSAAWGWFGFLGAWFFALLAPSSSVVPITTEIAAERRVYLALAAVVTLVVIGAEMLRRRALRAVSEPARRPAWAAVLQGRGGSIALGALFVALGTTTYERGTMYMSHEGIWRDVVRKEPGNPRGYDNLASLEQVLPPGASRADTLEHQRVADSLLRRSIAVDSEDVGAWYALALLALDQHRPADAIALLERVLTIKPQYKLALDRLGNLYVQLGQPERGLPYLERGVAIGPGDQSYVDLGIAYMAANQLENAAAAFRGALRYDPTRVEALSRLGTVLTQEGHPADAIPYLEESVNRDPTSGRDFALLALAYSAAGRSQDAVGAARTAAARADGKPIVFMLAGRAMLEVNDAVDAAACLGAAVQLTPDDPAAVNALADAEVALGKKAEAIQLYRRALALRPDFTPARQSLQRLNAGGGPPGPDHP